MKVFKSAYPHIVRRKGVCGGEPLIDGIRVTVRHVAYLYIKGVPLRDIAESVNLTEAQVIHGLSYFFDHRQETLDLIRKEEKAHADFLRTFKGRKKPLKATKPRKRIPRNTLVIASRKTKEAQE